MSIKKGDIVKILRGKDRGKTGKVLRSFPQKNTLIVENINLVKRHKKSRRAGELSERMTIASPIRVSNVQLVCPKCSKPTRIGSKNVNKKNVRVCKKCQTELS
jgi:large subunit ribosomal protein L24